MTRRRLPLLVVLLLPNPLPAQDTPRAEPEALCRIAPKTPEETRTLFRPTGAPLPFVSAHRGGPQAGYPENAIETFENTIRRTFAIMEVDPRMTRDGAIVLMHDETLDRTTTGKGRVADHTLAELKALRLKDPDGKVTPYTIPTLEEALEWARGRTILVLDSKDVSVADRVKVITKLKAEPHAMLILGRPEDIKLCHALNPNIMMEVFITRRTQLEAFGRLNIPWSHIVAFVGHTPPEDNSICQAIHERGAATMAGTSRNLDLPLIEGKISDLSSQEPQYRALLQSGVDVIETDIPTHLGPLLHDRTPIPPGLPLIYPAP